MEDTPTLVTDLGTDWKLSKVCPDVARRWRTARDEFFKTYKMQIRVTEGLRNFDAQWGEYIKGRIKNPQGDWIIVDAKKVTTHAPPGQSLHQYGLAIDSCFMGEDPYLLKMSRIDQEELWAAFGKILHGEGLDWGGFWPAEKIDRPHCEKTYGLSIHMMQMIYEESGLKTLWNRCLKTQFCGREFV